MQGQQRKLASASHKQLFLKGVFIIYLNSTEGRSEPASQILPLTADGLLIRNANEDNNIKLIRIVLRMLKNIYICK